MPRYPQFAERTHSISGSVFEKFRDKLSARGADLVGLHIGDAYAPPPYPLPLNDSFLLANPGFHRYCDTFGIAPFREALSEKLQTDNRIDAGPDQILVTAGATNALSVSVRSLVDPGDDVLLLAPYWPFVRGMIRMAGGNAIEVPFYTHVADSSPAVVRGMLETHRTDRTAAIYLNSPNNPSGKVLRPEQVRAVADFAKAHDLWLISDEAYDGMVYDDHVHISPASFAGMFERTISIFTFSKLFMFSGLRLGYAASARPTVETLNKTMVHTLYSPSTVAQQMMIEPVKTRADWSRAFVDHARKLRDLCVQNLAIRPDPPDGAYFLFFPITNHLVGRSYWDVINACLDAGVSVAPGSDFGDDFADYIRICFAGESPDRLELAIDRLNRIFPA